MSDWRVSLIVSDRNEMKTPLTTLSAFIRDEEQVITLFARSVCPPGCTSTDRLADIRHDSVEISVVQREESCWFAVGGPLRIPTPVTVFEIDEVHARTPFNPGLMADLADSTVFSFGVGGLGSATSATLTRAGIGKQILADPSRLEIENPFRHECTICDVGRFKTDAQAERNLQINPTARVECYAEDVLTWSKERLSDLMNRVDCIVATTDRMRVQLSAASIAHEYQIPAVFAGCYESAQGGEVFWQIPGSGQPCYCCLRGGMAEPPRSRTLDYTLATDNEDYDGEPGLDAAVRAISMAAAQVAIATLLRDRDCKLSSVLSGESNYVLLGSATAEDFYRFRNPFDSFLQPLSGPRKDCQLCQ